jgi:two-component system, cell cycle sensor histidine kinase and response regulator CckA
MFKETGRWTGEFSYRNFETGEIIPLYGNSFIIPDKQTGQPALVALVAIDLRERKKTEEALQKSQEQLAHSQKMEAIGRLAGGIAHDFNNVLTAIMGCSDLLLDKLKDEEELREELDIIITSANRASSLTRQLLAFSRKQILQPQPTNINTIINEVDKMLERIIGEDIIIDLQLQSDLDEIMIDRGQLEQVILNLAVNARDAMPEGGTLFIQTDNFKVPAGTQNRNNLEVIPGDYIRLIIRDTGVGMSEEVQNRIFEPFFTTKEPGRGTGLGLATVYGIVNQSNGYIRVDSKLGVGTTFEIWLPQLARKPNQRQNSNLTRQVGLEGNETILLVEDDNAVRNLTRRMLEKYKYKVMEAANGRQALALSESYGNTINLLITDMVMPEMSGQELIAKIRQIQPNLKVIGISGYSNWQTNDYANPQYYTAFVQKPFTSVGLVGKIREVLDTKETL